MHPFIKIFWAPTGKGPRPSHPRPMPRAGPAYQRGSNPLLPPSQRLMNELKPFNTEQGRSSVSASRPLAHGIKLKGPSKFEKRKKNTCTYGKKSDTKCHFSVRKSPEFNYFTINCTLSVGKCLFICG